MINFTSYLTPKEELAQANETIRQLREENERLKQKIDSIQQVCAAAYQLAGAVGAPLRFMDALGDCANGEPGKRCPATIDHLLPVDLNECNQSLLVMLARRARLARQMLRRAKQLDNILLQEYATGAEIEAWNALQSAKELLGR